MIKIPDPIPEEINVISGKIVNAAITVHTILGPGLLESAYETCLEKELKDNGITCHRQVPLPVVYKDVELDAGYRIDLFAEERVIIELKSVERLMPIHEAQMLTYLRLSGCRVGLLLNFNVRSMKNGIKRVVI
jgi:GxxExxY protein